MKRIKLTLVLFLCALTALWLMADTLLPEPFTYRAFRTVFMQYSGLIAIGVMSVAMMLALRPKWLEPHLDGLDKAYRLHKWLGITALVVSLTHWWMGQGTKWMTHWGWLSRQPRGPRPDAADLGLVEGWLRSQRGFAEGVGEWAFYLALLLMLVALVKRFPYHVFQKTHKWLAAAYLVLVYHAIVLVKIEYWSQPVGWVLAPLLAGGTYAAMLTLLGRIGAGRKLQGTIASLLNYPEARTLETTIALPEGWPGHTAGQFAFVTFAHATEAHPYTIASAWNPDERRITFITKALGDHTRGLETELKVGMPVTVEGPYGCFDFADRQPRQIWIGAGIGITPFIARMKQLAAHPDGRPVDLFHPTSSLDRAAIERLQADARAAGIRLHLVDSRKEGRLEGKRIRHLVPEWALSSIWFCGPQGFAHSLRDDFLLHRFPVANFHHELFEMR